MVGLRMVTYIKISPKVVNPRDKLGNAEEEVDIEYLCFTVCDVNVVYLLLVVCVCVCVCLCVCSACVHNKLLYLLIHLSNIFFIFSQQNDELRRQCTAQQKLLEKHKENLQKCLEVNKSLLIEKVLTIICFFTFVCNFS